MRPHLESARTLFRAGSLSFSRPGVVRLWFVLCVPCILAGGACAGGDAKSTGGGVASSLSGVYTADQAARGKDVYLGQCTSCHNVASHTGTTFATFWAGHRLSELYAFIGEKMPKNNPGTLSEQETADLIAYLLKMNAMPEGTRELPADSLALNSIRFDVKQGT